MIKTSIPCPPRGGNEMIIAVMGVTGSGKSSFIRALTGKDDVKVGHGLESGT
jgi:Fe-S cluster assembly ATPase SufC